MSIILSEEYGVNPSVTCCEICGKEIGIALFGSSWKDEQGKTSQAPPKVTMGICDDCKKVLDVDGCIIIEVKDGETGDNPHRTGRIIGISNEAKKRIFKNCDSTKVAYMEQSLFSPLFGDVSFESNLS